MADSMALRTDATVFPAVPPADSRRRPDRRHPHPPPHSALEQAMICLDASSKKLKKADAQQADDVLNLLRAATGHLHQALEPVVPGAE